jgi:hypothetical protein
METLIIDIPDGKSTLVKQLLEELGVIIKPAATVDMSTYRENLLKISVWTDEDIKPIEEARKHFESLRPQG